MAGEDGDAQGASSNGSRSLGTIAAEIVGLTLIINWGFSLVFGTIAEHSFMVKAINRLYTTRSSDD